MHCDCDECKSYIIYEKDSLFVNYESAPLTEENKHEGGRDSKKCERGCFLLRIAVN